MGLIFRAFDDATAKTVDTVVEYGVLAFGDCALLVHEIDMQSAVLFYADAYGLIGLTISKFRHAFKFYLRGFFRNPIKRGDLAGFGIKGGFVAVGYVKDVVLQILFYDEPSSAFRLAFDAAKIQAFSLAERIIHQPVVFAYLFARKI